VTRGHILPSRPATGEVLTRNHRDRRFVESRLAEWDRIFDVGDGLTDRDIGNARETHDVAGGRFLDVDALQTVEE